MSGVAFITGAGSGIGRATALGLAADGYAVGVLDRSGEHADDVARAIVAAGGRARSLPCDVSDDTAVADATAAVVGEFGRITAAVTSAGIFHGPDLQPIESVSIDDFRVVLDVNLGGTFSAIRHCLPFLADGGGAIVTIASTAAIRGQGIGPGYTASKGGVDALTRLVAVQYGPKGVRANCICPGGVDTPMTGGVFQSDASRERARRTVPIGRHAQAEDIADVARFLVSDGARHLTGQTIPVEGGATIA